MQRRFTKVFLTSFLLGFFIISGNNIVAQNCNTPTNVNTTNISNFSATLNWDADTSVNHYRLRYKEVGSGSWLYDHNVTTDSLYELTGLNVFEVLSKGSPFNFDQKNFQDRTI